MKTIERREDILNKATIWQADCFDVAKEYDHGFFALLITSTPYPGQRGFDLTPEQYFSWLIARLQPWVLRLDPERGVLVLNIMFKRRDDGQWDYRIFQIPFLLANMGLYCQDTYVWDKLNSPPSGNHDRHDRQEYEFCFVFSRSPNYSFNPQRKPYSKKTIDKAKTGNMRKTDVAGSHAGSHADLHPDGARQGNVLRISNSGDQGRPRVEGGVFARELVDRFVLTFTEPGDAVIDICMGSGTSVVRAVALDRFGVGVDIDADAFDTAFDWIQETIQDMALPLFDR